MPDTDIQKLLAFDYGKRRVGVGLGIVLTGTASPLETIAYQSADTLWHAIDELISEWSPQLLLIGLPNLDSGEDHPLEKPIRKFIGTLEKRYGLPTDVIDESFSSLEANNRLKYLRQSGRRKKIDKQEIDRQVAALLAERWMSEHGY